MTNRVVAVLAALLLACSTTPGKPTLMANMAKEEISLYQLRAMDYEYAAGFAQQVAAATIAIWEQTQDAGARDRAYQWRLWASPQARAAAFDQDPFAGLVELWVLAAQQHDYFTQGNGRAYFGELQPIAEDTTRRLEREAAELAESVVSEGNFERLSKTVRTWADEHPIEGQLFVRPTARADLASFFSAENHGGLKAVGSLEDTVRDMNDRITILTVQMPVEARWQAEYLVNSLFDDRFQHQADAIVEATQDITDFLGDFEDTLGAQTQALLAGIERERLTVFEALGEERIAVLAAIEDERESILDKLDAQLTAAAAELDSVGRGLIDHFFIRLIEVLAVIGVFVILTVLLVLVVVRRRDKTDD